MKGTSKSVGLNHLDLRSVSNFNELLQKGLFEGLTMIDTFSLQGMSRDEISALLYNVYETKLAKVHRPDSHPKPSE